MAVFPVLPGQQIDRRWPEAAALLAAQLADEFREGEVSTFLDEQAHGVDRPAFAAIEFKAAFRPIG